MKRALKWTSTVDRLEKCSLVNVDQEKCSVVDVDCQRSMLTSAGWSTLTAAFFSVDSRHHAHFEALFGSFLHTGVYE